MRAAIERVLAAFPDAPALAGDEATGFEASWIKEGLPAGVRTYEKQVAVFLGDAETEVSTVSQAIEMLRGIFEDRYVAVAGFKNEALVKCYLAPADNIGAGLNSPTHVYLGPVASAIDELRVRSWSGALDEGNA